jgi:hypothetical protein
MNKRDNLLNLIHSNTTPASIPAAFFMHFDRAYHQGQAAIDKHLAFFRATAWMSSRSSTSRLRRPRRQFARRLIGRRPALW